MSNEYKYPTGDSLAAVYKPGDKDTQYTGFSFNDVHFSELNIVRTSDGSRYNHDLLPSVSNRTVQVPGGDGQYYFGSEYTQREKEVQFAFDSMTEENFRKFKVLLADNKFHKLAFDEDLDKDGEYSKYLMAKVEDVPTLDFICFEENGVKIYKGEGSVRFVCYVPFYYGREQKDDVAFFNIKISTKWQLGYGMESQDYEQGYFNAEYWDLNGTKMTYFGTSLNILSRFYSDLEYTPALIVKPWESRFYSSGVLSERLKGNFLYWEIRKNGSAIEKQTKPEIVIDKLEANFELVQVYEPIFNYRIRLVVNSLIGNTPADWNDKINFQSGGIGTIEKDDDGYDVFSFWTDEVNPAYLSVYKNGEIRNAKFQRWNLIGRDQDRDITRSPHSGTNPWAFYLSEIFSSFNVSSMDTYDLLQFFESKEEVNFTIDSCPLIENGIAKEDLLYSIPSKIEIFINIDAPKDELLIAGTEYNIQTIISDSSSKGKIMKSYDGEYIDITWLDSPISNRSFALLKWQKCDYLNNIEEWNDISFPWKAKNLYGPDNLIGFKQIFVPKQRDIKISFVQKLQEELGNWIDASVASLSWSTNWFYDGEQFSVELIERPKGYQFLGWYEEINGQYYFINDNFIFSGVATTNKTYIQGFKQLKWHQINISSSPAGVGDFSYWIDDALQGIFSSVSFGQFSNQKIKISTASNQYADFDYYLIKENGKESYISRPVDGIYTFWLTEEQQDIEIVVYFNEHPYCGYEVQARSQLEETSIFDYPVIDNIAFSPEQMHFKVYQNNTYSVSIGEIERGYEFVRWTRLIPLLGTEEYEEMPFSESEEKEKQITVGYSSRGQAQPIILVQVFKRKPSYWITIQSSNEYNVTISPNEESVGAQFTVDIDGQELIPWGSNSQQTRNIEFYQYEGENITINPSEDYEYIFDSFYVQPGNYIIGGPNNRKYSFPAITNQNIFVRFSKNFIVIDTFQELNDGKNTKLIDAMPMDNNIRGIIGSQVALNAIDINEKYQFLRWERELKNGSREVISTNQLVYVTVTENDSAYIQIFRESNIYEFNIIVTEGAEHGRITVNGKNADYIESDLSFYSFLCYENSTIAIMAISNEGYQCTGFNAIEYVEGQEWPPINLENPSIITIDRSMTYQTAFDKKSYKVSVAPNSPYYGQVGINETIMPYGEMSQNVLYGDTIKIIAQPRENCYFVEWLDENGERFSSNQEVEFEVCKDYNLRQFFWENGSIISDEYSIISLPLSGLNNIMTVSFEAAPLQNTTYSAATYPFQSLQNNGDMPCDWKMLIKPYRSSEQEQAWVYPISLKIGENMNDEDIAFELKNTDSTSNGSFPLSVKENAILIDSKNGIVYGAIVDENAPLGKTTYKRTNTIYNNHLRNSYLKKIPVGGDTLHLKMDNNLIDRVIFYFTPYYY